MAKVRVHELAKELGVESKVVLAKLKEMGEFVKSASSTVEPPVVKRFSEKFGDELKSAKAPAARAGRSGQAGPQGPLGAGEVACPGEPRTSRRLDPGRAGSCRVRPGRVDPGDVVGPASGSASRSGQARGGPGPRGARRVGAAACGPRGRGTGRQRRGSRGARRVGDPGRRPHRVDPSSRSAPGSAVRPSLRRWRRWRRWPSRVPATGQQPVRTLAGHGAPSGAPSGRGPRSRTHRPSAASAGRS